MGFFSDEPIGIKGSSEMKELGHDIRETMHSSGIFGGPDQARFVSEVFDVYSKNKDHYHGREVKWGEGVIEPHEAEEALSIISKEADKYHIKPEQIAKLREHIQKPLGN